MHENGSFCSNDFNSWFEQVTKISKVSGHTYPVLRVIGKILFHSPESLEGLWIEKDLAEFLNQRGLDDVRDAYKLEAFNSRGVHFVDPEAKPEIQLSTKYKERSESANLMGLQRFSRTLREISERYASDAESIIKRGWGVTGGM